MKKEIIEMNLNPEKKFAEMVEEGRKSCSGLLKDTKRVIFAGWQMHYVIEDSKGNHVLSSLGGYSEGFDMDDYEH